MSLVAIGEITPSMMKADVEIVVVSIPQLMSFVIRLGVNKWVLFYVVCLGLERSIATPIKSHETS